MENQDSENIPCKEGERSGLGWLYQQARHGSEVDSSSKECDLRPGADPWPALEDTVLSWREKRPLH